MLCCVRAGVDLGSASLWSDLLSTASSNAVDIPSQVFSAAELPHPPLEEDSVIYSGTLMGCVAVNLKPHRAYGFRLVCTTLQGDHVPSPFRYVGMITVMCACDVMCISVVLLRYITECAAR